MHWYNIFVVFTAHHCHWTSLGNAHSLVGGWWWWCLSSFARQGVVSRGLGLTLLSTQLWRLPPLRSEPHPLSPAVIYHIGFCTLKTTRGSINGMCGESGWRRWGWEGLSDTRYVGLKHLCAQQRYVSSKHVYSELIYRSVGETGGWLWVAADI